MTQNVIMYRRVSTDEQAQRHSLDFQKDIIERYCALKNYNISYDIAEDHSAKNFERPEWEKILLLLKKNKGLINCIIVLRWDRFARNAEFALTQIRNLKKLGVKVISIEQDIDLDVPENKVMLNLYLTLSEVENDKNSIRTTEGSRKARQKGLWTGTAPFGYKNYRNELNHSTLIPNEKASLVTEIFQKMSTGAFHADTIRKEYLSKGTKMLSKQAFLDMLRNVVYIGKVHIAKYKDEPEEDVIGIHPAIIDSDIFNKVQQILKRKKNSPSIITDKVENYPLKGSLVCPKCSHVLVAYTVSKANGKAYPYYECQKCNIRFGANIIHDKFVDYLSSFQVREEILILYQNIIESILEKEDVNRKMEIRKSKERVEEFDTMIEGLKYKLAGDKISTTDYKDIKSTLEKDKSKLVMTISELNMAKTPYKNYLTYALQLLPNIVPFYENADNSVKRRIISSIFPEKLVFENNNYRTLKPNSLFSIISLNINDLKSIKKKQVRDKSDLSTPAPPPRLERGTP